MNSRETCSRINNNMTSTTISNEILRLRSVSDLLNGYFALVVLIIGTVGNTLNIIVFIHMKTFRKTASFVFLLSSFINSIILVWTGRFPQALISTSGIDIASLSPLFCASRTVFGRISQNLSLICISLVSIDRFLISSRIERCRRLLTKLRAIIIVLILFIIYLSISIEDAITYYWSISCRSPNAPFIYTQFVSYFSWIVTFGVPLIIITIFSLFTWRNLRFSVHGRQSRLEEQVNRLMFAQFSLMFISTLPIVLMRIYRLITDSQKKSLLQTTQETLVFNLAVTLGYASPIGSFYLYFIVSPAFRQNVQRSLICKKLTRITPFIQQTPQIITIPT